MFDRSKKKWVSIKPEIGKGVLWLGNSILDIFDRCIRGTEDEKWLFVKIKPALHRVVLKHNQKYRISMFYDVCSADQVLS